MTTRLMDRLALWASRRAYEKVRDRIERVESLLIPGQEFWLFNKARALRDGSRILELGSYKGRSTLSLAFACVGTRKHVFSVDRWQGMYDDVINQPQLRDTFEDGFFETWMQNVVTNRLEEYVTPLVGDSRDIAEVWRSSIDLLFVDASHKYEDVVLDFDSYYHHVAPGGLMAFHDITPVWAGCWRAWHEYISPQLVETGIWSTIGYGRKREH